MRGKHLDGDYRYGIKDRPTWCPLIALPDGHGRLIDKGRLCNEILNSKDKPEICDGAEEVLWIERCISIAPTIVPAEKEDTQ